MSQLGRRRRRVCGLLQDIAEFAQSSCNSTTMDFKVGLITDQNLPKLEERKFIAMKVTLTDIQEFDLSIAAQDRRGNAAALLANPTWAPSDPALLEVTPSADGLSAHVKALGPVGVGQITVSADGGPNAGDDPFTGILDVEVVSSKATQVVFTPSAPTDQAP